MNLSFFIAKRYFFSKKKKNFINVIAIISMIVVSLGTAVLIIALSVFNGMEDLLKRINGEFDADLLITPIEGKSFHFTDSLKVEILSLVGVDGVVEVVEDNALLRYNDAQKIVRIKGVSDSFIDHQRLKISIREGEYALNHGGEPRAILGRGVQYKMAVSMRNEFSPMQLYYPKNIKPGKLSPGQYYNKQSIWPSGVFALEQSYDNNYIFVPLSFAESLFDYEGKRTALELVIKDKTMIDRIQSQLTTLIGQQFVILNADQQHTDLYKVLKIEKLFVFIILSSVVSIASINIFFALSMLVIEKKKDIKVLSAMGASGSLIRRIFLSEGVLIILVGAGSGLGLGFLISWTQETFGFITMGVANAVESAYPVKIVGTDFIFTAVAIVLITFLASIQPAIRAGKIASEKHK